MNIPSAVLFGRTAGEPSPTKLTEKIKDLKLQADSELINVPHTRSSEQPFSSQHSVNAWLDGQAGEHGCHSEKGGQVDGQQWGRGAGLDGCDSPQQEEGG